MKANKVLRCSREVYDGAEVSARKCRRKATVMRGGMGYCRQHDPKPKKVCGAPRG